MQTLLRSLLLFVFAGYSLTAPLFVVCHESGPGGHDRLEFVFATCCADPCCQEGEPSCPDLGGCESCIDTPLEQQNVLPSVHPIPAYVPLSIPLFGGDLSRPMPAALAGCRAPDRTGEPPLFLSHCSFRI